MVYRAKIGFISLVFLLLAHGLALGDEQDAAPVSTLRNVLQNKEIRIGMNPGFMPFEMEDNKGNVIGFDVDLSRELAKSMGVKSVLVVAELDALLQALVLGKVDVIISGVIITPQRNLEINFSDSYLSIGQSVIINSRHQSRVAVWQQLNDARFVLGCMRGSPAEETIRRLLPKARVTLYDNDMEGAMAVINGRTDAWVHDLPFNVMFQAQHGRSSSIHLHETITYAPLGIGVRHGDVDMLNFVNNFLRQIQHDGRYQRIYDKWIVGMDWVPQLKAPAKPAEM